MPRMIHKTLISIFFLILCISGTVMGREIYVDNMRGNDAFTGHTTRATDESGPVRTIQRALDLARNGDHIILTNNPELPYRESLRLCGEKHSGIPGFPFRIIGNGAVLDGSAEVPPHFWHSIGAKGIFVYQPLYIADQNLFYRGKPIKRLDAKNVRTTQELLALDWQPMRWCLCQGKVYFKPKDASMVLATERLLPPGSSQAAVRRQYAITAPEKQFGILLSHVCNLEIQDLTIQGFQNDGLLLGDMAVDVKLTNVTSRGNARAGISVGTGCALWMKDCVLGNNQAAQLVTEEGSLTSIFTSELIPYPAPAWVENGGDVYRDRKKITGGLSEIVDTGFEDEPNYFGDEAAAVEEVELEEETAEDGDVPESEEDEAEEEDGGFSFGADGDEDSEEEAGDGESEDDGGFDFGGDEDSEEEPDDGESEDDGGFDFGGDEDSEEESDDGESEDDGGFDFGGDEDSEEGSDDGESEDDGGFSF
ncbi:MAG: right-handed parallel beta-helix repeat-containing protein [Thermoguttaceae bacterium]|nr:right-handed parallel beta-helix repeat-containing protein [Thermoguttaceae bacterium]